MEQRQVSLIDADEVGGSLVKVIEKLYCRDEVFCLITYNWPNQ